MGFQLLAKQIKDFELFGLRQEETVSTRKKAFSYLRFSSPEQAKGDSFRRQNAHALDLDDTITFHDLGVSAYRGVNSETGQLGTLLNAVQTGVIPKSSIILVESLDRISRQAARKALRAIESIVESGVSVVTLSDKREYTIESLDNDPINLLMALLTFIRANEESAIKSQRIAAAWTEKRKFALEKPMTARSPTWINLSNDRHCFELNTKYAIIVQRIFAAALEGRSVYSITRSLNEDQVPTLSGGGRRAEYWQTTSVSTLLQNRAVTGTLVPHIQRVINGGMIRSELAPIRNYYPSIVSEADFDCVQKNRSKRYNFLKGVNKDTPVANILARLSRCSSCGSALVFNSHAGPTRYMLCKRVSLKAGCHFRTVRYNEIENSVSNAFNGKLFSKSAVRSQFDQRRLGEIKDLLKSSLLDRSVMNRLMRSLFSSITVDIEFCKITFNWKNGDVNVMESAFTNVHNRKRPRLAGCAQSDLPDLD
jgi:DNA invertase Pin-like site-specific DNA recombinase